MTTKVKKTALEGDTNSAKDTETRILAAATKLFAQKGYDAVSIKEICEAAKVNIAAIHYHFDSKENLYGQLLGQFASTRLDFARKTLQLPYSLEEFKVRLEIFMMETLASFPEQAEVISIIQREMDSATPNVAINSFIELMDTHCQVMTDFFVHAKKEKILATEVDPFLASMGLMSQFVFLMKKERHLKRLADFSMSDPKARRRWVEHMVWVLINGAKNRE